MESQVVEYDVNKATIAKMSDIYMHLTIENIEDHDAFDAIHHAKMVIVKHRTGVNKLRLSANKNAQDFIKKNNKDAAVLIDAMAPIESHLATEEKKVTDEKKRIAEEVERKEQKKIEKRIEALNSYQSMVPFMEVATLTDDEFDTLLAEKKEAYEVEQKRLADEEAARKAESERLEKLRIEQEAEATRLEEIRLENEAKVKAEADRLSAERAEINRIREEQRKETEAKERTLENERKVLEDEKRAGQERKEREAFEKQAAETARIKAEADAKARAEKDAREAKEKLECEMQEKIEKEKAEAAEKVRLEALRPDKEKITQWSKDIEVTVLSLTELDNIDSQKIIKDCADSIFEALDALSESIEEL